MRLFFYLLLVLALLATAGCTSDELDALTVTPTPAPQVSTPATTFVPLFTPAPAEMAYLEDVDCSVIDEKVTTYRCLGKIRIKSGSYSEVQVIAKYPDKNTFESGVVAMGGTNPVLKSFSLFPDLKYKDQDPLYSVRLDKTLYPVVMNGTSGIAYVELPQAKTTSAPGTAATTRTAVMATTKKPTITTTTASTTPVTSATQKWIPTVSSISPATAYPDSRYFTITGWDFRQDPSPKVYLRRVGSSCEFCGIQAIEVRVPEVSRLECIFNLTGEIEGPADYDVLVSHSELEDSYAILKNGVRILQSTPVPTEETTTGP